MRLNQNKWRIHLMGSKVFRISYCNKSVYRILVSNNLQSKVMGLRLSIHRCTPTYQYQCQYQYQYQHQYQYQYRYRYQYQYRYQYRYRYQYQYVDTTLVRSTITSETIDFVIFCSVATSRDGAMCGEDNSEHNDGG